MVKGDKQTICVTVDLRLYTLAKRLGINRSHAINTGLKSEIAKTLKTFNQDITVLEKLSTDFLIEDKRETEFLSLAEERIAQQEYIKNREKELQIEEARKTIIEYRAFCADHKLPEITFAGYITGSVDDWKDYSNEESLLFSTLEQKNLCADKNRVREIIGKQIPMMVKR